MRNEQISTFLAERSDKSFILTAAEGKSSAYAEVRQIHAKDYRHFLRGKSTFGAFPEEKKKSWPAQQLIKLINTFPFSIILGEGGAFYYLNLLRSGSKIIREEKITHLYSSYRPFADHYAAYKLKRKFPHIVWMADFRDLIIEPNNMHIYFSAWHQRIFRKIFSEADILTTVSKGLAEQLKKYNDSVVVVRNGIRHMPVKIAETHCKYFRLAYTGSMFLDKRNAVPLFEALQELIHDGLMDEGLVKLIYAGKDSEMWKKMAAQYELEEILIDKGVVPYEEARKIQQDACINILLTISSPALHGILTGKLIEYLESGSPVAAIISGQDDPELKDILSELGIGSTFTDKEDGNIRLKDFIFQEYLYWKSTGTNRKPVNLEVLRKRYSVESVMGPLNPLKGTF